VKTKFTKVIADIAPALRPQALGLLRNGLGVQLARAVAGRRDAPMMVSVEVSGWWGSSVMSKPQVDGLGNAMWSAAWGRAGVGPYGRLTPWSR